MSRKQTKVLNLEGANLKEIVRQQFKDEGETRTLILSKNRLTHLNYWSFEGLVNLTVLYLDNNKLIYVDKAFQVLRNLKELNLCSNNIREIYKHTFEKNQKLQRLKLVQNNLTSIEINSFSSLCLLRYLNLSYTNIGLVETPLFDANVHLKSLSLLGSHLIIRCDLFAKLTNLVSLDLGENDICDLEPNTFINLKKLEFLHLSKNNISVLRNGLFRNNKELIYLDLADNEIELIEETVFNNLVSLCALFLKGCSPRLHLHPSTFINNKKLCMISISLCQYFPFDNLSNLSLMLDSKNTNYKQQVIDAPLPSYLASLKETVESLQIKKTTIVFDRLNELINQMINLTQLQLINCGITALKEYVFLKLTQLITLNLNGNKLNILSNCLFGRVNKLINLSFESCEIFYISFSVFSHLHKLRNMSLKNNFLIDELQENLFCSVKSLKHLNLKNCNLRKLPANIFRFNTKLKTLNLTDNCLTALDMAIFKECKMLKVVYYWTYTKLEGNFRSNLTLKPENM